MLKDKLLHDRLGIPIQTLQNWKNSEGYTALLYKYLVSQDQQRFIEDTERVAKLYDYELMTPHQFAGLVEEHWEKFDIFAEYLPPSSTHNLRVAEMAEGLAVTTSRDRKRLLFIRYAYAMSKKKEHVFKEVEQISSVAKSFSDKITSFRILYVSSSQREPKYLAELDVDVQMVNYATLYKEVSTKHLLIV